MTSFSRSLLALTLAAPVGGCIIETNADDAADTDASSSSSSQSGDSGSSSTGEEAGSSSTGADGSSESGLEGTTGDSVPMSDCTPYEPTMAGDTFMGSWSETGDEMSFSFTTPGDPGGGFVRIELVSDNGTAIPQLVVTGGGDTSGDIASGSAAGTDDTTTKYAAFSVDPGVTYDVRAISNTGDDSFTLTWTFESLVDCWEPNDSPQDAAMAIVGEAVEAYAHAGFESNALGAEEYIDWYRVELDEASGLRVTLDDPPAGHRMRARIWADPEQSPLGSGGGSAPEEVFTAEAEGLEPGSYLISVEVAEGDTASTTDQQPEPQSWSTPYSLSIETF